MAHADRVARLGKHPEDANVWLRYPHVVTCAGSRLQVFVVQADGTTACSHSVSLKEWEPRDKKASSGRGSNLVHGCDMSDGWLVCGMASGVTLAMDLRGGAPEPSTIKLEGHTNVVACVRLAAGAVRLVTSSFDKSARLWSLPGGETLQVVKTGTPALQLALLPLPATSAVAAESAPLRVLMGCGDGTVRLWDSSARKASRSLRTLRFAHQLYVGELRLAADGSWLLSCSRDGELQLWTYDGQGGYSPEPDVLPRAVLGASWRLEVLADGVLALSARGAVDWWPWGAQDPQSVRSAQPRSAMLETPADTHVTVLEMLKAPPTASAAAGGADGGAAADGSTTAAVTEATEHSADHDRSTDRSTDSAAAPLPPHTEADRRPRVLVALMGLRRLASAGSATDDTSVHELEVHAFEATLGETSAPASAPARRETSASTGLAPAGAPAGVGQVAAPNCLGTPVAPPEAPPPAGWARWCELAGEEGVAMDEALRQRLSMMEGVAAKAGRELTEASVRAFLRRHAAMAPPVPDVKVD